jgi:phosphomethylpyrimidine synthase
LRAPWIAARGDVVELDGPTSAYGRERLADPQLAGLRFDLHRKPRRAKPGANVSQMHYARRGLITPEMEFIAIRENLLREEMLRTLPAIVTKQHAGQGFGAAIPRSSRRSSCAAKSRVAGRSSRATSITRKPSR